MKYIEDKVEILQAESPVLEVVLDLLEYLEEQAFESYACTENKGLGPTKGYEYIENIGSGAIIDKEKEYLKENQHLDEECKTINIFFTFYNIFRSYIYIPILNIWKP